MVQYLHTPWRDRAELLKVRRQFYPSSPTNTANLRDSLGSNADHIHDHDHDHEERDEAAKQHAVSRVSMWMQRGGCPHLVESTALLMAAILSDLRETRARSNSSPYAMRAAYSAAFSRFVTGLLDSQQDKQRKMSMYSIAKTIGLPATFVELRHQATHEQLPSLLKLRTAARKALVWIWEYYWKNLSDEDEGVGDGKADARRDVLLRFLRGVSTAWGMMLHMQLKQWDETVLLQKLAEIGDSSEDPEIISRSLRLSQVILAGNFSGSFWELSRAVQFGSLSASLATTKNADDPSAVKRLAAVRDEVKVSNGELEAMEIVNPIRESVGEPAQVLPSQAKGWVRYEGPWKPKPIGVV